MITFILSVKHYQNCHSYESTWKILENTLVSIYNQTDKNFEVIVVSNKTLTKFDNNHQIGEVKFIEVDWNPPAKPNKWQVNNHISEQRGWENVRLDKGTKFLYGISSIKQIKTENHYVMLVDADDFIHKHLATYINSSSADLLRICKGFQLGIKNKYKYHDSGFYNICGTCNVHKLDILKKYLNLENIKNNLSQSDIISLTDDYFLKKVLGGHKYSYNFFTKRGYKPESVPFPAVVYNCSHEEQLSGKNSKQGTKTLTDELIQNFSIKTLE
tara:strand:- start:66 stop:878 length:813 start_codon:yes stop_codon:yes gene_type:complete